MTPEPADRHVFYGSRHSWWVYVVLLLVSAVVLAVPIFVPGRGGIFLQAMSGAFAVGAMWAAWRGTRAGTVWVTGNDVVVFGAMRTWKFKLEGTRFEARLVPLPYMRTPHVVLVAHVSNGRTIVMRSINSGARDAHLHKTWVDAVVAQLNGWGG
ncbi:hypothetical protein GCM10028801_39230 [Nocardioides maradonensis]